MSRDWRSGDLDIFAWSFISLYISRGSLVVDFVFFFCFFFANQQIGASMLLHNRHPRTGGYLPDELTPDELTPNEWTLDELTPMS